MRRCLLALLVLLTSAPLAAGAVPVTNGDDGCDIATAPAATLLLPYFEVDFKSNPALALTTIFTVTNVSPLPQIAHVVVWTDWSFPAMTFNVFLTGFDTQGVNLHDLFARGVLPSAGAELARAPANPNVTGFAGCTSLPGTLSPALLKDLQLLFTTGRGGGGPIGCTAQVGGAHANAIGYITIDVAPSCHALTPTQSGYFERINFDNVLTGDYEEVDPNPATGNHAGGNPLVHIRAVPEGGPPGSIPGTNLPYTFYDRYTAGTILPRTMDRRQPLPSTFAARFIQGGTGAFNTTYKIWREGVTTGVCSGAQAASLNSNLVVDEVVRFDEHENATVIGPPAIEFSGYAGTPVSGRYSGSSYLFPSMSSSGDVGGWMYLNLGNGGSASYSAARAGFAPSGSFTRVRASQNWVIVSTASEGRYAVDYDAAWLGNGCSPAAVLTTRPGGQIGPARAPSP